MADESGDDYQSSGSSGSNSPRPNRWDGPASTWQDMNRQEINTLTALDEIKSRDLSIHLYNAFALKQRHRKLGEDGEPVPEMDINAATGGLVHPDDWRPPYSWTAWPMSGTKVPPDAFMSRDNDDHDDLSTIRKPMQDIPSAALEDAIGANILRFAKTTFTSRPSENATELFENESTNDEDEDQNESAPPSDTDTDVPKSSRARSRSRAKAFKHEREFLYQANKRSDDGESGGDVAASIPLHQRVLEPSVSVDDHLSYDLMRPAVRNILTKLDATLTVLHHSRDAAVRYLSDSSSDSEPETLGPPERAESRDPESPRKRKRGRPIKAHRPMRARTPPPLSSGAGSPVPNPGQGTAQESEVDTKRPLTKKLGRPKKTYPRLEGESDRAWANRVARLRKEPIPFPWEADDLRSSAPEIAPMKTQASERHIPVSRASSKSPNRKAAQKRHNSNRLGLRDWKDVLGAAALAGFSQDTLDRAARRCADLFQDSMELHSLDEGLMDQDGLEQRIQYHPGMVVLDSASGAAGEGEDISSDDETRSQMARHIRASSAMSVSSDPRGRSRSRSRSVSRASTRSRSRSSSVAAVHYCSVRGCSRGAEGFARRYNLLRHMKLVHHMEQDEVPTDVDSEDEMHGAVHVDGFLRPIKTRKGWRGENARRSESVSSKRPNAGRRSKRRDRHGSVTDTGGDDTDVIMGED